MTKNILYFLIRSTFSFFMTEKGFTTELDYTADSSLFFPSSASSKKTMGAHHLPPLGPGEVALRERYLKLGIERDLSKVRVRLMPCIYGGVDAFIGEASLIFNMAFRLAEGLYYDYKPIYDAFREAYEQDSERGQDLFVNKAVSQFKIDAAYARILYDALKPSPSTLVEWQKYKQASSNSSSSSSSSAAATPPQETAEEKLKKLLLSNTLNSGSAAAAKTPPLQEEKEQTLEEPPVPPRKPFTGLRHRNLSPPD